MIVALRDPFWRRLEIKFNEGLCLVVYGQSLVNNKLRQLQTKKQAIQKSLVTLNNDIASKKEYLTTNEVGPNSYA